ncbi:transposase [Phocaeicola vulgatus]|nr:transposase [Phocaeicola vulgatus]MCM1738014.1 transposase [Phocaeicola vulgatus]MCM1765014.1 transposase [Phocaeicola vulgatus]MCM1785157.1 transposase [Phocaeicola vulgatus]
MVQRCKFSIELKNFPPDLSGEPEVEKFDYMEFNKVLDTFSNHSTTIINYFEERLTNASAESFNAKIKAFRSQLRGVADLKFFMFRLARLYA